MPQPKYRDMTWEQLDGSTQRALRWLNACTLLSKHDLLAVAFPPGHDRQRVDHALTIWQREAFVATVDDCDTYRLGEYGAAKLRNAGIDLRFDGNDPAYRVRTGLLLAGQFAVGLALDLAQDANITHFTWSAAPFSGDGPHADGVGELWYSTVRRPSRDTIALNILHLASPTASASGQVGMRLLLEIDLSTETESQLERRAERWRTRLRDQRAHIPPNCWPYVLWVTDGGWERANTIWRAWIRKAGLPLFITTTAALPIEGRWRPWRAAWRDEHGRPRTSTRTRAGSRSGGFRPARRRSTRAWSRRSRRGMRRNISERDRGASAPPPDHDSGRSGAVLRNRARRGAAAAATRAGRAVTQPRTQRSQDWRVSGHRVHTPAGSCIGEPGSLRYYGSSVSFPDEESLLWVVTRRGGRAGAAVVIGHRPPSRRPGAKIRA